jgi:hypothetical protein
MCKVAGTTAIDNWMNLNMRWVASSFRSVTAVWEGYE